MMKMGYNRDNEVDSTIENNVFCRVSTLLNKYVYETTHVVV